jgi:peptidoglycan hydrolase-like protein with peptidoglycan-binding domain
VPTAAAQQFDRKNCLNLEVSALTGPAVLAPGGVGTILISTENPNPADTCDDGMSVEITFNGTATPVTAIDGGPDIVCGEADQSAFAHKQRCVAATFPGGSTATITMEIKGIAKSDRIAAGVAWLAEDPRENGTRPGKLSYRDMSVTAPPAGAMPAPGGSPAPKPQGTSALPTVRVKATGTKVEAIQYLLRQHGQDVVVDGDFGPQTEEAVRTFQGQKSLTVDGVVGTQTWIALFVTVKQGDSEKYEAVSAAQSLLAASGIDVAVDGDFGPLTDMAVRDFQKQKGLTVDGVVGPQTWAALVSQT